MEKWWIIKAFTAGPLLEAAIPKPGNVSRYRDFPDLSLYHFIMGNTAVIPVYYEATKVGSLVGKGILTPSEAGIGELIRRGVEAAKGVQDGNPNFGIITLSVPLIMALSMSKNIIEAREKVELLIRESTPRDTMEFYRAIRIASPKGVHPDGIKYDVYSEESFKEIFKDKINLEKLAEISCERELIFCEWLTAYELAYSTADRILELMGGNPLEKAVRWAFVELMAERIDTLILRKAGRDEAELVKETAMKVIAGELGFEELERFMAEKEDLRNPGSLADVTAISLSLLILMGLKVEMRDGKVYGTFLSGL